MKKTPEQIEVYRQKAQDYKRTHGHWISDLKARATCEICQAIKKARRGEKRNNP